MAARLCSFSRLTSVTTEPSLLATYRGGTRLRAKVVPAQLAPAERRKVRPEGVVGRGDVVLDQIPNHTTAKAGMTTAPVKVEPVVPVRRAVRYCPALLAGRSSNTR